LGGKRVETYQNIVTPYYFVREYLTRVNQEEEEEEEDRGFWRWRRRRRRTEVSEVLYVAQFHKLVQFSNRSCGINKTLKNVVLKHRNFVVLFKKLCVAICWIPADLDSSSSFHVRFLL
jgi:hypothetical protein